MMNLVLLDNLLNPIAILDGFKSFIWTDRYSECGDFELYTTMTDPVVPLIKLGYYITNDNSSHVMIIDHIETETTMEDGDFLIVKGKSLESILYNRIVWNQTTIDGKVHDGIKKILNDSIINPTIKERTIPNFIFEDNNDPYIQSLTVEAQYTGDVVYDVVKDICESYYDDKRIGFKIRLEDKKFIFSIYHGEDRSSSQSKNVVVLFSTVFDNLLESNYIEDNFDYKNVTLVAGEGEGSARKTAIVGDTTLTGLARREIYSDARDISSNNGSIPANKYTNMLKQRGNEVLGESKLTKLFDCKVESTIMYVFNKDFFIGDIIEVQDKYGNHSRALITEFIQTADENGYVTYPSLMII